MLLNTPKLEIINSSSEDHISALCMRTQKHLLLRALLFGLFPWMRASQNKIPICIRNMTWYEGTTFTIHSSKFVAVCTRNCISRKKEIKVIITIKFFTCTVALLIRTFHRAWQKKLVIDFFFVKQAPCLNSLITEKEEGDASAKFNTYTNNHFLVYLTGHLKTKPINSVSYMTVRAGIIKGVRQTNTC